MQLDSDLEEITASGSRSHRWSLFAMLIGPIVAIAIVSYELTRPNQLFGVFAYDDGVYYGLADRFVHGALAYRDFVYLHPPGIAIVLSPVALIGRVMGSHNGIAIARVVTGGVAVANVVLVGRLIRHRGPVAIAISSLALALFPLAISADHTVLLDPYLAFFSLLGINLVFSNGSIASTRTLLMGGLALGFAGAIKIEAILPTLGILAIVIIRARHRTLGFLAGVAIGFTLPCLPFFLAAPHAFIHDVLLTQLDRASTSASSMPTLSRLVAITGVGGLPALHLAASVEQVIAISLISVVGIGVLWRWKDFDDLISVCLVLALCSAAAVLVVPEFYLFYVYLPFCFFSIVIGPTISDLLDGAISSRPNLMKALTITGIFLAGALIEQNFAYASAFIAADSPRPVASVLAPTIPPGACVIFDEAILAIVANRFDASGPCPEVIDPFGTWLSVDPHHPPPSSNPPSVLVSTWENWLSQADFLVEVTPQSDFIPWTPALITWFDRRFRLVVATSRLYEYTNLRISTALPLGSIKSSR